MGWTLRPTWKPKMAHYVIKIEFYKVNIQSRLFAMLLDWSPWSGLTSDNVECHFPEDFNDTNGVESGQNIFWEAFVNRTCLETEHLPDTCLNFTCPGEYEDVWKFWPGLV